MSSPTPLRVVIADDAPAVRSLLRDLIDESPGFRVVGEAADGEEAVRVAADEQPDVVLLDLAMPVLDGLGAIPRIRACSPDSRIVVLSGFSAERMSRRAYDQGADAYVEKGEPVEALLARLTDITAAAAAEDAFQTAFDHAPVGIAIETLGAAPLVNDAYRRITAGGSPVRITRHGPVTYVEDLTEQQRAEIRQRIEADHTEELARSNAELAHFASVAAHELRSPLQVVAGFASVLERSQADRLDERGRDCVEWIVNGAARLDGLIDDLLAFARVGAGETVRERVDLETLVDAEDPRVTHDHLPTVVGDPQQLRQLLQNLIGNGCKFVAPGTTPHVHVSAARQDGAWRISVADNGVGIPPAQRDQVFEMFRRLHGREKYEGTGIGLAICKRIVDGHGGRLWVDANPGGGSVFRFTVPDAESPSGAPAGLEPPLTDPATGLPNRAELRYRLERALARAARTHESVSLIWVRVGAANAPEEVGRQLRQTVRPHDTVGRVGPGEFAILCVGLATADDGRALRDRLAAALGEGVELTVTTGGGDQTADELLAAASAA